MQPRREPHQSGWRRWQGNADLWPVLPVGAGTAARSAAKGVYHAAVRMMLNAGVPAERRTTPNSGSFPPPACGGLCRPGTPTVQMAPLARERRPLVGTAARSAANGVYHAAVQMTLNAGVPAERRTTPELGVLLCRPPTAGCADRRSAWRPCLRVARHRADQRYACRTRQSAQLCRSPTGRTEPGSALSCLCATLCERRLAERAKNNGSELCSLPA